MLKHDPNDWKPCWHMRTLMSAWIDGALSGLARWYLERHVADCPRCRAALPVLRVLHDRLHGMECPPEAALSTERWAAVEAAWEQVDRARAGTTPGP